MPFRINLNFTIAAESDEVRTKLLELVELDDLSHFLNKCLIERDILNKLASGAGVTHEQIKMCQEEYFASNIITAAKEAGFPRGEIREVANILSMLSDLFQEQMLADRWMSLMFQKYCRQGRSVKQENKDEETDERSVGGGHDDVEQP